MTVRRGTIVYAADPFKERGTGRPWAVVNTSDMPFHGDQYVVLALSTKTWHDDRLSISSMKQRLERTLTARPLVGSRHAGSMTRWNEAAS